MVSKGILEKSSGDCIITGLSDRRFLYEPFVGADQVFDYSIIPEIEKPIRPPKNNTDYLNFTSSYFAQQDQFSNFQIINLTEYALPPTYCTFGTSEEMLAVGYDVPEQYWNKRFITAAQKFNFFSKDEINNLIPEKIPLFIIIHHRYSASIEKLNLILNSLPSELIKVVFTSSPIELKEKLINHADIFITDDLKAYSSLLNDSRCKLLISEWSGAGQVAQYTLGSQGGVWFYYDHYPDIYNFSMTHKIWEHNSKLGNYFNCWDFKNISGCNITHFSSFNKMIDNCKIIKVTYN